MENNLKELQAWAARAEQRIDSLERDVSRLQEQATGLQYQIRHLKESSEEPPGNPKIDQE